MWLRHPYRYYVVSIQSWTNLFFTIFIIIMKFLFVCDRFLVIPNFVCLSHGERIGHWRTINLNPQKGLALLEARRSQDSEANLLLHKQGLNMLLIKGIHWSQAIMRKWKLEFLSGRLKVFTVYPNRDHRRHASRHQGQDARDVIRRYEWKWKELWRQYP